VRQSGVSSQPESNPSANQICQQIHRQPSACAGVQMHEAVPATELPEYDIEEDENPTVRLGKYACGHLVVRGPEYFENELDPYALVDRLL